MANGWKMHGREPSIYRPSSLGRAMLPGIMGQYERSRGGLVVGYSCTRSTRGVRLGEERLEGVGETLLYILPWAILLNGLETFGPHPEIWPLSAASSTRRRRRLGSWPALCPAPVVCLLSGMKVKVMGMHMKVREREFRESRWRQAVMVDMAKWGFRELGVWRSRPSGSARDFGHAAWGFVPSRATV